MTVSTARLAPNRQPAPPLIESPTGGGPVRPRRPLSQPGLAGQSNLLAAGEDLALIDQRTAMFRQELEAPGAIGELLAQRAAVHSIRMEQTADYNMKARAARIQVALDEFDAADAAILDGWISLLDGPEGPHEALRELAALPEGIAYLQAVWGEIRAEVANGSGTAASHAACWLRRDRATFGSLAELLGAIDAERTRLDRAANSAPIQQATIVRTLERHQAGVLASFDTTPEAILARRYEAASERGMFRAMAMINRLKQGQTAEVLEQLPSLAPAPPRPTPPVAPEPAPTTAADPDPLGSFRTGRFEPTTPPVITPSGPVEPPVPAAQSSRKRPDLGRNGKKRR